MATPTKRDQDEVAGQVIDSFASAEKAAIEAVRNFVETVNRTLPDVGEDGGTRQQIIDSAFKMTEQLVGASNELAAEGREGGAGCGETGTGAQVCGPAGRRPQGSAAQGNSQGSAAQGNSQGSAAQGNSQEDCRPKGRFALAAQAVSEAATIRPEVMDWVD